MPYDVTITDTKTGEVRIYQDGGTWTDSSPFLWSDGNYSCDCNRAQFFREGVGEGDPNKGCGNDRYTVSISAEGKVVYEDGP